MDDPFVCLVRDLGEYLQLFQLLDQFGNAGPGDAQQPAHIADHHLFLALA